MCSCIPGKFIYPICILGKATLLTGSRLIEECSRVNYFINGSGNHPWRKVAITEVLFSLQNSKYKILRLHHIDYLNCY